MPKFFLYSDTIHIIESLTAGRTGLRLFEDLEPIGIVNKPPVSVCFWRVRTRAEFIATLNDIARDTLARGRSPILHIEAHGGEQGIETASGEFVPWPDFKWELVAINQAGRTNLLVVLAACKGAYLIQSLQPAERAPFFALVGPNRIVSEWEIECGCLPFYKTALASHDGDAALQAMNAAVATGKRTFTSVTAIAAFRMVFREYVATCTDESLAESEARILAGIDQSRMSSFERAIRLSNLRTVLRDHPRCFTTFKERFFFCDLFPENVDRFKLTYEECLPSAGSAPVSST